MDSANARNENYMKGYQIVTNEIIDKKLLSTNTPIIRLDNYINAKTKIHFKCKNCNFVWPSLAHVLYGRSGCIKCSGNVLNNEIIDEKLLNRNIKRLGNYINCKTKVTFQCLKENCNYIWDSLTGNVVCNGHGCPKCANNAKLNNEIIDKRLFDYKLNIIRISDYITSKIKLKVRCTKCNWSWKILPNNLNKITGCLYCGKHCSKIEQKWLSSLHIINDGDHRQVTIKINNKRVYVDGFDPLTNTIYEFYGDYYHGNPNIYNSDELNKKCKKTFGELYNKTIEKENLIKNAGYNLVTIWESDFRKQLKEIK